MSSDGERTTDRPLVRREDSAAPAILSSSQERYWVLEQEDAGRGAYTISFIMRIEMPLDAATMTRAFAEVVQRHDILRTTFERVDGGLRAVVRAKPALTVEDTSSLGGEATATACARAHAESVRGGFDLARGPLLRALLVTAGETMHFLTVAAHHTIADGTSLHVLREELVARYDALRRGEQAPLEPVELHYADYATWERAHFTDEALREPLAYWKHALEGAPAELALPFDRPRPSRPSGTAGRVFMPIGPELVAELIAYCRRERITLFTALLAAVEATLFLWSGEQDLVVGTVYANRARPKIARMQGCFVNFVPLRTKVDGGQSMHALVGQLDRLAEETFVRHAAPFEKIVDVLRPEYVRGRNPLYNVGFLFQNFPATAKRGADGLRFGFEHVMSPSALLDLRILARQRPNDIELEWEYATDLFDRATLEQAASLVPTVVEHMLHAREAPLGSLARPAALLAQVERAKRIAQPLRVALVSTYTVDPVESSVRLWLRELGIRGEVVVAPYGQVFQELLSGDGVLGSNRHGMNVVAVRLEDWRGRATDAGPTTPAEAAASARRTGIELAAAVRGSAARTGTPHLVLFSPSSPSLDPRVAAALAEIEGEVSVALAAVAGVTVVTSAALAQATPVERYGDDVTNELGHVPYTKEQLAALGTMIVRVLHAHLVPPYRALALGGEAHAALKERAVARGMHVVTLGADERVERLRSLAVELGIGLDRFIFVDDHAAAIDEVRAACPEVLTLRWPASRDEALGLLRRCWALDPWRAGDARSEPREGEVARQLWAASDAGEPRRVLERLAAFEKRPGDAKTYVAPRTEPERRLAALFEEILHVDRVGIADDFFALGGQSLSAVFLASRMQATFDVRLLTDEVFLNPTVAGLALRIESGAVERSRAPVVRPEPPPAAAPRTPAPTEREEAPVQRAVYRAPETARERAFAEIFAEALQVDRVGLDDDFLETGGSSLVAMQIMMQVRDRMGIELSMRDILDSQTVAGLARLVEGRRAVLSRPQLVSVDRTGALPLAAAQAVFVDPDRVGPRFSRLFHLSFFFRVEGRFDTSIAAACLTEMVVRHEALRSWFQIEHGVPVMRVGAAMPISIAVVEVPEPEGPARQKAFGDHVLAQILPTFDLTKPPLMRVLQLRVSPELSYLSFTMHHVIIDGWGMLAFKRELVARYAARVTGTPASLRELPFQPGDFNVRERTMLNGPSGEEERVYWDEVLRDAPSAVALPFDHPPGSPPRSVRHRIALDPALAEELASRGFFVALWSALAMTLSLVTGQRDLVIGTIHANRDHVGLTDLIGSFANFLALRARIDPDVPLRVVQQRLRDVALDGFEHAHYPFIGGVPPNKKVFHNVFLALEDMRFLGAEHASVRFEAAPLPIDEVQYRADLLVRGEVFPDVTYLGLSFDAARFELETIDRIGKTVVEVLTALLREPEITLAELAVRLPRAG